MNRTGWLLASYLNANRVIVVRGGEELTADTPMLAAIGLAIRGDSSWLSEIVRNKPPSAEERHLLADYLDGKFKRPRGKRGSQIDQRGWLIRFAADRVRRLTPKLGREKAIAITIEDCAASRIPIDEEALRNFLKRPRKRGGSAPQS